MRDMLIHLRVNRRVWLIGLEKAMTTEEALDFLRLHQPLPPTRDIDEGLLKRFDEVRKHFAAHPDVRCVPLLLNSFGEGDL